MSQTAKRASANFGISNNVKNFELASSSARATSIKLQKHESVSEEAKQYDRALSAKTETLTISNLITETLALCLNTTGKSGSKTS